MSTPRLRRSRVGVYPVAPFWAYRVEAPSGPTVMQGSFPDEASARQAAAWYAKFYDDLERHHVQGVREVRMKRPVARGERVCETCGKPHNLYELRRGKYRRRDWSDPEDGHPYRAESWETLARRLLSERVAA